MYLQFFNFNKKARCSPNKARREQNPTALCEPVCYRDLLPARPHFPACLAPTPPASAFVRRLSEAQQTTSARTSTGVEPTTVTDQRAVRGPTPYDCADRAAINILCSFVYICFPFSMIDLPVITPAVSHCSQPPFIACACTSITVKLCTDMKDTEYMYALYYRCTSAQRATLRCTSFDSYT